MRALLHEADEPIRRAERAVRAAPTIAGYQMLIRLHRRTGNQQAVQQIARDQYLWEMNVVTRGKAEKLSYGDILYHLHYTNADGSRQRWKVTGKVKFWKTRPWDFRIPVKYGMRDYGYVTPHTADDFSLDEE